MSSRDPERPIPRRRLARPPVRSTSPSEAPTSTSAAPEPAAGSSYLFSSLSGVWASLKAAAALEVGGFVKALNGGGAPDEPGHVDDQAGLGDKRGRSGEQANEMQVSSLRKKRRKVRTDDAASDLLFDGVTPLMPPIAHSSWFAKRTDTGSTKPAASSPVVAAALRSSTSPIPRRSSLRFSGTAATTYEDELMRSTIAVADKGLSPALAAPRTSGDIKHRRDASGSGSQPQFSGSQSVRASSSFFGGGGGATMRKAVWRPWIVGQQLLAAGDNASLSSSASLLGGQTPHTSLADELAACEGQHPDLVTGQISRARQEEDRRVEQGRIDALEEEVRKLRNELSVQRAFNSPGSAFAKAPRVSAAPQPPPPPPPPPPPVGGPHPMLLTARAKLRATPERPKRRHSTMMMGGAGVPPLLAGLDMTTLMSEVGDQRRKLRKVGLPKERTQEELRRERAASGTSRSSGSGKVLQRSLKRKAHGDSDPTWSVTAFTKTTDLRPHSVSPDSAITCARSSVVESSTLNTLPTALTTSRSASGDSTGLSDGAATATQSCDDLGRGPSNGPISSTSHSLEKSSKDADDVDDADYAWAKDAGGADTVSPDPHRPQTAADNRPDPRLRAARVSITQPPSPASPCSPTAPKRAMSSPIKQEDSTAVRRRRLRPALRADPLPGLEFGYSRPLTPGRRQKKQHRAHVTEQGQGLPSASSSQGTEHDESDRPPLSPRPNTAAAPRSPQSPRPLAKTSRRNPRRVRLTHIEASSNAPADAALEEELVAEAEATLTGRGERAPDPNRVFGRA